MTKKIVNFLKTSCLKSALKYSLRKIAKKMENETFFSPNRNCDLDMIWHQDKYWKASTGSTLEGFKLGLVIFDEMHAIYNKI